MVYSVNKKNTWIDSLKGIAICGVVMIHSGAGALPSVWGVIGNAGKYGVQLFLLISGYLAYASLERQFGNRYEGITFKTILPWWKKKIIRLLPLYYVAIVLALLLEGTGERFWLGSCEKITFMNVLSHFLFLHGMNPYHVNSIIGGEWYLAVLVAYFFLAPWLYKYINSFKRAGLLFLVSTVAGHFINNFAVNIVLIRDVYIWEDFIRTFWLPAQFPVLALGGVLYFLLHNKRFMVEKNGNKALAYGILLFAICLTGCQLFEVNAIFKASRFVTWALCFSLIIISQALNKCILIDNIVFRKIGGLSYPIYLIHLRIISLIEKNIQKNESYGVEQWLIKYMATLLISYTISWLLVKYLDIPVRKRLNS